MNELFLTKRLDALQYISATQAEYNNGDTDTFCKGKKGRKKISLASIKMIGEFYALIDSEYLCMLHLDFVN